MSEFIKSANRAIERGDKATAMRILTEGKICRKLIKTAIAAGFTVSVFDGEEWTVKRSRKVAECVNACFTTDMDQITVRRDNGDAFASFQLIYGNDGFDVIADYGYNQVDADEVAAFFAPIEAYAEQFAH